jgi:cell division protein FtsW (lipid II flippase)
MGANGGGTTGIFKVKGRRLLILSIGVTGFIVITIGLGLTFRRNRDKNKVVTKGFGRRSFKHAKDC